MSKRYVIGLMAANRTGILAALATAMSELGGDIHEASQTVMQKFCTITLAADFPEHRDPQVIVNHIRGVCRPFGVEVFLKDPADETMPEEPPEGIERYFLTLTGHDAPGILGQISGRLARDGVDVTDLYALRHEQELSFVMILELAIPPGVDAPALRSDLEQLGAPIGLSATLQHESVFPASSNPRPVRFSPHLPPAVPRT